MKRSLAAWMALVAAPVFADEAVVDGRRFVIPDGFRLEKVAGSPLVDRPITAAFDDLGRLYVADSSGTNDNVQKQLADKPHRIVRLEDTDGDGTFDKSTVFADKMMFPEGTMWLDGSLYVAAPPQIWKLTDTDDDGIADRREAWFDGKTLTGCANDLHGPYPGPDGRIYWAKGAFANQTYEGVGKGTFNTRAAHIFRARPDGTEIEPVMTGGMDNPVDVVFTPGGERLVNGTFFVNPGNGLRDGIIHAIYGGIYGKIHDPIFDPIHKWTGPEVMPILVHLGPAAPSGLHRYESPAFGPSYRHNVFSTCFNLHKVTRSVLKPKGATFDPETTDLVASADNLDFHPTDLVEDADGSLLIVDTGGWYKLCCPTSQLHKPDILGAIYRLRKADSPKVDDPRGLDIAWNRLSGGRLFELLEDSRPAVRERAVRTLAKRTEPAVANGLRGVYLRLKEEAAGKAEDPNWEARLASIWAACRIERDAARSVPLAALDDTHPEVRQAALHAIALAKRPKDAPALIALLTSRDPHNRRAAAEGLGRIGDASAVPALLAALAKAEDRILEHSLTYALIEIGDADAIRSAPIASEKARRAALIALDQIGGALDAKSIAPELDAADPATREVAAWIVGRHPEWGGELAGTFRTRIDDPGLSTPDREALEARLARFAKGPEIQALLADRAASGSPIARVSALRAMARSGLRETPAAWSDAVLACLKQGDSQAQAVATARALAPSKDTGRAEAQAKALLAIARDANQAEPIRLGALAASPPGPIDDALFAFLQTQCDPDLTADRKAAAADVLGRAKLTRPQLLALLATVRKTGPMEIGRLLAAYDNPPDDETGLALIDALGESPAFAALRVDQVLPRFAKLSPEVRSKADALGKKLNADLEAQRAKLEQLLGRVGSGDVRRGQAVFHGTKAACIGCHQMGYVGGKVGPDLTSVGKIRTERDLLEAIVFPSASFVRSYEPVTVATKDGRVVNGIVRRDTPEELVLATTATDEVRIARDDLDEIRPGTISVMPAGLDQQLTEQELADLVAFLKASNR
ncbi:MAG: PVC-type heme-binding CxxCH protein [Isosphaeraceae bacterium]